MCDMCLGIKVGDRVGLSQDYLTDDSKEEISRRIASKVKSDWTFTVTGVSCAATDPVFDESFLYLDGHGHAFSIKRFRKIDTAIDSVDVNLLLKGL